MHDVCRSTQNVCMRTCALGSCIARLQLTEMSELQYKHDKQEMGICVLKAEQNKL